MFPIRMSIPEGQTRSSLDIVRCAVYLLLLEVIALVIFKGNCCLTSTFFSIVQVIEHQRALCSYPYLQAQPLKCCSAQI